MEVHIAPDQPPRLTAVEDLKRFSIVAAADPAALADLALDRVLAFEGQDHAWVSVDWLMAASGQSGSESWRAGFEAMRAFAAKHGWTRDNPPAIRGHVVWQGAPPS
ncbi:hypothetical protein GWK16_20375 [Roseomonas sp. JC162]|uniref:Uncharacterized protein n=1 Tax=Neoroseomonas marina TaxID=1232220 RepID=A0A848EG39_9PROT|nr:hypothetical protein [Neoroseomonas marina]NMJ43614.1 hypothetical protein [Neoroseomonas marina]